MAHAAPPPPSRKRNLRLAGAALLVLGVVLLGVAIVSLTRPKQTQAGRTTQSQSTSAAVSTTRSSAPASTSKASATPSATPTTPPTNAPTTAPTTTATVPPAVTKVALIVANNTGETDLASTAANRFEAAGWQVTQLTNFSGGILSTCAYYDPSNPANLAAAQELQHEFPAIKRVKARFDGLPSAPIVVVLTTDYS